MNHYQLHHSRIYRIQFKTNAAHLNTKMTKKKKSTTKAIEQKANPTELIHQSGSALQINMTNNHQMSITPKSATQIKMTNNYQMGIHPKPNSAKSFNKTIRFSYTNHNKTQN